jgi:2,4-dienoyl-CoA reductase-like NADH-dependent reductase (Old Yellow Enzyme family)
VSTYPRVASFKTAAAFREYLDRSGISLALDDQLTPPDRSPLAAPLDVDDVRIGNRFCILPMEGWDGTREGTPSDLTIRRWQRFGGSGAKLIWGGEAVAVRHDGRANPNQLLLTPGTVRAIAALRASLVSAHRDRFGSNADGDLLVGLQLTHSGRFSRPDAFDRAAPLAAHHHPLLDRRFPNGVHVLDDDELERIADAFLSAARLAWDAGFAFVDVKQCHGYLGHELLGAKSRDGGYGGPFDNRIRFLRRIVDGIQATVPGLRIAVRLSAFDTVPYLKAPNGIGRAEDDEASARAHGFGVIEGENLEGALGESKCLISLLRTLGVRMISVTAGSPYYNPHIQRPAMFPPLDGYEPPEDPLRGVARHINATAILKRAFPDLVFVGSAYSYLQEWLSHVGQHAVRTGMTDFVGLGRIALSYPDLPADVLAGVPLRREFLCRTFSDCTTAPRLGMVSGCYPLDRFYTARPQAIELRERRAER